MINLVKMDVRRMSRSKMFYIGFLSLVAGIILTAALLRVMSDPDIRNSLFGEELDITAADQETFQHMLEMKDSEALCSTLYSGSFFFLALYIVIALFVCSDYDSGFAKNIFALEGARWKYYAGKLLCSMAVCAVWIIGSFVVYKLAFLAVGLQFLPVPLSEFGILMASYFVVSCAFAAQAIFISVATRSKGAGVGAAIILGGGIAVSLLESILNLLGLSFVDKTLIGCVNGVTAHFSTGQSLAAPLTVSAIWFVIWTALSILVIRKRDI